MNNFACPCCKRLFRVGAMMLVLHDASDVFLEAAKVFKYSEKQFGASFCFGLFALSWLLLRLIYFPFWIIRESRLSSNSSLSSFFFFFLNSDTRSQLVTFHLKSRFLLSLWSATTHAKSGISRNHCTWRYTICSIRCCWLCLFSTFIGGSLYVRWS